MKKRTICMSMILALCLSLAPGLSIPALAADPVTCLDPLDKEHPEKVCSSYSEIEKKTKALGNGWYVVTEYVDCTSRIEVTGHANLILGASMNVEAGIRLPDSSACSLTIWGQTGGSGRLSAGTQTAPAPDHCAGIGGGNGDNHEDGGTLTVNGGVITAAGGKWGAGIGGGNVGKGGKITINGVSVTAQGGSEGAGIGGGDECDGGTVEITGGTVEAKGGQRYDPGHRPRRRKYRHRPAVDLSVCESHGRRRQPRPAGGQGAAGGRLPKQQMGEDRALQGPCV